MANGEQLNVLLQGATVWNKWRKENPYIEVDLCKANLVGANLSEVDLKSAILEEANLSGANLAKASLYGADLWSADLSGANLIGAILIDAILIDANFDGADLTEADLGESELFQANLNDADLTAADLSLASLVETTITGARLTGCRIYGISAWGLMMNDETEQKDLIITPEEHPIVTVDDIEIAQFIYLLLHSNKMRQVIDTLTAKTVLILGRFTPKRKAILDSIREELRKHDYVPLMFDFKEPLNRDFRETISILARISRFVIVDITNAKSIPAELELIVPFLPSVPIMPLALGSSKGYALFDSLRRYPWVIEPYRYGSQEELIGSLVNRVIAPAEAKVKELKH